MTFYLTNKFYPRDLNVISTPDNIKYSKLLLIVLATIVTVSALAALAISIYDIIRGQQASSTTTSTMTCEISFHRLSR